MVGLPLRHRIMSAYIALAYSMLQGKVVMLKVSVLSHAVGLDVRRSLLVRMNSQDTTEHILVSLLTFVSYSVSGLTVL